MTLNTPAADSGRLQARMPDRAPGRIPQQAPELLTGRAGFTRALGHDFTGYLVSLGLLNLGTVLLLPLITAYFTPADLGLYSLVETALVQGITFSLLGLKFSYLYYYAQTDAAERPRLLGLTLLLAAAAALAAGLLLTLLFASAPAMALFDATPLPMAWLLLPLMLSGALQTVLLTELRAARHVWLSGAIAVCQLAVWLLLSVALVAYGGHGLPGLLGAQAIAQVLSCLVAIVILARRIALHVDLAQAAILLRYGIPLMLGLQLRYSLDTLCRFLLAALVSIEAAGLFLVISRVTLLFDALLALPFFTAWGGLVHHALRQPDSSRIVARVSSLALAAGSALVLLMLTMQPMLFSLLAHDAMPAMAAAFALLLLSRFVLLGKTPLTAGILRSGQTGWAVSNNLLALVVFLAAAYPAARLAGLPGIAAALLVANALATATLTLAAWRHCPQRLDITALALTAVALGAAAAVMAGLSPDWLWGLVPLAGLLLARLARHVHVTDRL